ncbi:MAG: hypothetical protein ACOX2U_00220 [Limisphaerales bacterium]|jgi:N-acetylglutamate synthase-like GNAT family acetyltransferase|nr:hypothetical protein [Verrucomicrobiota bacterium]
MQYEKLITRRATVEDLPQLNELWKNAHYPADIFEKRLTEFHLVEDPVTKRILACIGIHPESTGAMIHSEVFGDPLNQDLYRDMLWPRFQILSRNLGASKIWTQEPADFWLKVGFENAAGEALKSLPNFPDREEHLSWKVFQIFDEEKVEEMMKEDKYEALLQIHQGETEAFNRQLRLLRNVIISLGIIALGAMLLLFLFSFVTSHPSFGR